MPRIQATNWQFWSISRSKELSTQQQDKGLGKKVIPKKTSPRHKVSNVLWFIGILCERNAVKGRCSEVCYPWMWSWQTSLPQQTGTSGWALQQCVDTGRGSSVWGIVRRLRRQSAQCLEKAWAQQEASAFHFKKVFPSAMWNTQRKVAWGSCLLPALDLH